MFQRCAKVVRLCWTAHLHLHDIIREYNRYTQIRPCGSKHDTCRVFVWEQVSNNFGDYRLTLLSPAALPSPKDYKFARYATEGTSKVPNT